MPSTEARDDRRERGRIIALTCRITFKNGFYLVPSQHGNGFHRVKLDPPPFVPHCTCKDYEARQKSCKHWHAVQFHLEGIEAPEPPEVSPLAGPDLMKRTCAPRPTYPQAWRPYNTAQIREKEHFRDLLRDLCRGIPEPPTRGKGTAGGRPPVSMADRAFAVALKVYTTISGRRASTDIRDAHGMGHVARAPHFSTVARFLEDPTMTPILCSLIGESARPLASVEEYFAVDSSGFSTSRFVRWFDVKHSRLVSEHEWLKCHLMTGTKTNVVTAVEVGGRNSADTPRFVPLLEASVARGFKPLEVSADSAYCSYDNMEAVATAGGVPYIAFKVHATGRSGGLYEKMFHYYSYNRENFLSHYHKRSNVESTFAMVKGKFGDHIRSKTDPAKGNELLAKILCHNVCCLIQSMYELRIAPLFWGEAERAAEEKEAAERKAMGDVEAMGWI